MGIGEKGFRTTHLKLIGPCLIGIGVILSLLRILVCFLPSRKTWCRSSDNLAHKSESAEVRHLVLLNKTPLKLSSTFLIGGCQSEH